RRQQEFKSRSQLFIDALDVDDVVAHLLVTEGFSTVEEVAFVPLDDLTGIEGFDEEVANELRDRARAWLEKRDAELTQKWHELGVDERLAEIDGLNPTMLVTLGEKGVKTLDDLADLASDELREMLPNQKLGEADANAIIMAARAHWFEGQPAPAPAAGAAEAAPKA
ncbi:MAG TPA: helix-hairpin-helix domain-containing protein, partial [Alphaproteobacteria bacterium]|nr:helix-hairpin-helix domain-containing protein [Alphaproteobacteria bacterium]